MYKSFSILTFLANSAMLALEAAMHMPFAYIPVQQEPGHLWKFLEEDEKIFTRMLTETAICGMIAMECHCSTAVGMRMQRRRLPPGLLLCLTLPGFAWSGGEYYPL